MKEIYEDNPHLEEFPLDLIEPEVPFPAPALIDREWMTPIALVGVVQRLMQYYLSENAAHVPGAKTWVLIHVPAIRVCVNDVFLAVNECGLYYCSFASADDETAKAMMPGAPFIIFMGHPTHFWIKDRQPSMYPELLEAATKVAREWATR